MQNNNNLKYKRQFIATSQEIDVFEDWNKTNFLDKNLYIYTHPELEITTAISSNGQINMALLGFVIDPNFPNSENKEIIEKLLTNDITINDLIKKISNLAGRFVIFICVDNLKYVINDMSGLRSVYFSISSDQFYFASNPALLSNYIDLKPSKNYQTYINSNHLKNDIEYWLPSGLTLYDNVEHLIPNHFFDLAKNKQVRYWPYKKIKKRNLTNAVEDTSKLLENLILSAKNRYRLALPITAGWDSRVLLAASKNNINDIFLYTLQYRWLVDDSPDIKIPRYITKKLGLPFNKIDCRNEMDPDFYKIYKSNVDLAHDDWANITNGMKDTFPQNRVVLKGNVSEIARCSFYPDGYHDEVTSAKQFPVAWPEWLELDFIMDYQEYWMSEVKDFCKEFNIDIFDLWYMEIFMGVWQAQGQLEWDIIHEEFTPYNYRPLIETMLGVPVKYRLHDKPILYQEIIKYFNPNLLYWPINPPSWNKRHQIKYFIADKLKKVGLYNPSLKIYQFFHPIYLRIKGYKKPNK